MVAYGRVRSMFVLAVLCVVVVLTLGRCFHRVETGLGDSGDRLFGTVQVHDESALVHPSVRGRKRTMSQG